MALREADQPWASSRCAQCGGPSDPDIDRNTRRRMGCDAPLQNGRRHEIPTRNGMFILTTCPRKHLKTVAPYFRAWRWWDKGQIQACFPRGVPSRIADGIEYIDSTISAIQDEKCPRK